MQSSMTMSELQVRLLLADAGQRTRLWVYLTIWALCKLDI